MRPRIRLPRRIAAAIGAPQHDVTDAAPISTPPLSALAGLGVEHAATRLDDSMTVFTRAQGELDFLLRDPAGIRIARFTTTGLRFADAAGHELSAASFPLSLDMTEPSPIQTPYGFRFLCREQEKMTLESGSREKPVSYTNFGWLVDEEGRKKTRLEGPKGSTCSGMRVRARTGRAWP